MNAVAEPKLLRSSPYRILPFRFARLPGTNGQVFVSSEAGEFAVLQELKIAAGEFRFDDFVDAPEEDGAIGSTCFALPIPQSSNDLLPLVIAEKLIRTNEEAGIGIVFDGAAHEGRGSEVGSGSLVGHTQRGEAAPEVERVGEFLKPDFFGEKELGFQRSEPPVSDVTPADEFVVFDDVVHVGRI